MLLISTYLLIWITNIEEFNSIIIWSVFNSQSPGRGISGYFHWHDDLFNHTISTERLKPCPTITVLHIHATTSTRISCTDTAGNADSLGCDTAQSAAYTIHSSFTRIQTTLVRNECVAYNQFERFQPQMRRLLLGHLFGRIEVPEEGFLRKVEQLLKSYYLMTTTLQT